MMTVEFPFELAQLELLGEITASRVIFGPWRTEPISGVTALESVGITLDPASGTLNRLPAISAQARSWRLAQDR